jgi:transcription initiation factor IIE alpha subunit
MLDTSSFQCPQCAAAYQVVRVEAEEAADRDITCPACGAPLQGRDGSFILKYFLTGMSKRPRPRAAHASLPA